MRIRYLPSRPVITKEDTARVREALRRAGIKGASVRKFKGSMRYTLAVTSKREVDHPDIIETVEALGYTQKWKSNSKHRMYFERRSG